MKKSVHTDEYALLCKTLKTLRIQAAMTQRDVAQRLDVPHSWVAKVEMAERRLDVIEFCRYVLACGGDPKAAFERIQRAVTGARSGGGRT